MIAQRKSVSDLTELRSSSVNGTASTIALTASPRVIMAPVAARISIVKRSRRTIWSSAIA